MPETSKSFYYIKKNLHCILNNNNCFNVAVSAAPLTVIRLAKCGLSMLWCTGTCRHCWCLNEQYQDNHRQYYWHTALSRLHFYLLSVRLCVYLSLSLVSLIELCVTTARSPMKIIRNKSANFTHRIEQEEKNKKQKCKSLVANKFQYPIRIDWCVVHSACQTRCKDIICAMANVHSEAEDMMNACRNYHITHAPDIYYIYIVDFADMVVLKISLRTNQPQATSFASHE